MNNFLNHGLGTMRQSEHDYLLNNKMITCDGEIDMILCDYPKLIIPSATGEKIMDYNGNISVLEQEMNNFIAQGKNAYIRYTPKRYAQYVENKKRTAKQDSDEAFESLVTAVEPVNIADIPF